MTKGTLVRMNASALLAIAFRTSAVIAAPGAVLGTIKSFYQVRSAVRASNMSMPDWSFAIIYGSGLLVELLMIGALFAFAKPLSRWICGTKADLVFSGSVDEWTSAILQFMGVLLILRGMESLLMYVFLSANSDQVAGRVWESVPMWSGISSFLVATGGGFYLLLAPKRIGALMKARR